MCNWERKVRSKKVLAQIAKETKMEADKATILVFKV